MSAAKPEITGSKFAWRDVVREGVQKRSATERVADFLEIYGIYDEQTAREQASRCVQCPEPQCVAGCPLSNRIPEWLALTAEGHFLEAAALLHSTSSLPEICARMCPADRMCEGMCILNGKSEPVSIWAIERFLNEYAFAHEGSEGAAAPPNGLRVAVVGAGPGGLTCADVLSKRGYAVTVLDWRLVPGGLLVSGSPAFRLDRSVINRRVEILQRRGVAFRLGVDPAEDLNCSGLLQGYDAVFLGFGARKARDLVLPGRELRGVMPALSFLLQTPDEPASDLPKVEAAGKRVVVVGGGDMAVDCIRAARRVGAREVIGVYRRGEAELPCGRSEYMNAVEEGAQFVFQAVPAAFLGDAEGRVRGLRLLRTEPGDRDGEGRTDYKPLAGSEFELAADLVILALGFEPVPLPDDSPFSRLARSPQGHLAVDARQMTSLKGVFAGGELVRGPSRVLDVVRDARRAAEGIDAFLQAPAR